MQDQNAGVENSAPENAGLENIQYKYKFYIDACVTDTSSRPQYTYRLCCDKYQGLHREGKSGNHPCTERQLS